MMINETKRLKEILEIIKTNNSLDNNKDTHLCKIKKSGQFIIIRIKNSKFNKKSENMEKPNFYYYPTLDNEKVREILLEEDDRAIYDFDISKLDAEVLILEKKVPEYTIYMLYKTLVENYDNCLFDVLKDLQDIFGLIYNVKRKEQLGISGELLFMKLNEKYFDILNKGFHFDGKVSNDKSIIDFLINRDEKEITFEVKTTSNDLFTIKDSQNKNFICDFFVAIKLSASPKKDKENTITFLDLINWYLEKNNKYNKYMHEYFSNIKNKLDIDNLDNFNKNNVVIKLVSQNMMPVIHNIDLRIKKIVYEIDILALDSVELSEIL